MDWKYGKFKLLIIFICFTSQFSWSSGVQFKIKNTHCGKFVDGRSLSDTGRTFTFVPVDGIWGYIEYTKTEVIGFHDRSGDIYKRITYQWSPSGGASYTRREGTNINVITHNRNTRYNLFAIDQINNHIIHRDGMFVEYSRGFDPYPPNGDILELTHTVHDGMAWLFLNPNNLSEAVYPYGGPKITGEWELVYAVQNPLATQTWEYTYTIGKSVSKSTSKTLDYHEGFEFTWESSRSASGGGGFSFWGIGVSAEFGSSSSNGGSESTSLSRQIASASEDTWFGESTETSTITVQEGKTVVVWQKVFIGSQHDHKAVFQSNIFAYTNGLGVKPDN